MMMTNTGLGVSEDFLKWEAKFLGKKQEPPVSPTLINWINPLAVPPPGDKEVWFDEYKWWLLGGAATIGIVAGIGGSRGAQAASRGARKAKITRIGSVIPVLLVAGAGLFLVGNITGGVGTAKFLSS